MTGGGNRKTSQLKFKMTMKRVISTGRFKIAKGNQNVSNLKYFLSQLDRTYQSFRLHSIMSEHKQNITCIEWHPQDDNILGSSSLDPLICIWNISKRQIIASFNKPTIPPALISWCSHDDGLLSYVNGKGPIYFWKFTKEQKNTSISLVAKEAPTFSSFITQIKWHPHHIGKIAIGHENGTISMCIKGKEMPIRCL